MALECPWIIMRRLRISSKIAWTFFASLTKTRRTKSSPLWKSWRSQVEEGPTETISPKETLAAATLLEKFFLGRDVSKIREAMMMKDAMERVFLAMM